MHHVQKSIVNRLAFADSLRFSELKTDGLESKLFDYHLKLTIVDGLVKKNDGGHYQLTQKGKQEGLQLQKKLPSHELAESVLFLLVRREVSGEWLLYTRSTHPLKDRTGFMHTIPNSTELATHTAANVLKARTGLTGLFSAKGSGFFRIYQDDEPESFTNFTLLVCEDASGDLNIKDVTATYEWITNPDFSDPAMLPNMSVLYSKYLASDSFFLDQTIHL
ncbi:MAG: hypothetical protein ACI9T8_000164 [Candidatus Saccharimonadales bacterium]|jgi:hypothetical protein